MRRSVFYMKRISVLILLSVIISAAAYADAKPDLTFYTPDGWDAPMIFTHNDEPKRSPLNACEKVQAFYAIKNIGNATAKDAGVMVYLDGAYETHNFEENLAPGQTLITNRPARVGKLEPGDHTIEMRIDEDNNCDESDEKNNTYKETISVSADCGDDSTDNGASDKPSLALEDISVSAGSRASVDLRLRNAKGVDIAAIYAHINFNSARVNVADGICGSAKKAAEKAGKNVEVYNSQEEKNIIMVVVLGDTETKNTIIPDGDVARIDFEVRPDVSNDTVLSFKHAALFTPGPDSKEIYPELSSSTITIKQQQSSDPSRETSNTNDDDDSETSGCFINASGFF